MRSRPPPLKSLYFNIEEEDKTVLSNSEEKGSCHQKTMVDSLRPMTTSHKRTCTYHIIKVPKPKGTVLIVGKIYHRISQFVDTII